MALLANGALWQGIFQPLPQALAVSPTNAPVRIFGAANGNVNAEALSPDGSILYLGGFFTFVGTSAGRGAKFSSSTGAADPALPYFNNNVNSTVADGSGGWFVGGAFTLADNTTRNHIAHIQPDGTLDTAWDPNVNGNVNALVRFGTTLYIGGDFTTVNGATTRNRLAAISTSTGTATFWDPNVGTTTVYAIAVSSDGATVYVGGDFTTVNGATTRNRIAAILASTGTATSWDPNVGTTTVFSIALSADGTTVYIGGSFTTVNGGTTRNRLAALSATTGTATSWDPNVGASTVYAIAVASDATTVYVGGDFTTVNGATTRNRLAEFSATTGTATTWDPNAGGLVSSLAVSTGGTTVYAGGTFTTVNGSSSRNNLAEFSASTATITSWDPNPQATVRTITVAGSSVYAGGDFTLVGGGVRNRLAAINTTTGALLPWDPNVGNVINALAVSPDGTTVYAGGGFTTVNNGITTRNRLAAFSASTGTATAWDPNASSNVNALALSPDGATVYAAGIFATVNGGTTRNRVAALSASTGTATTWDPNLTGTPTLNSLAVSSDGSIVYIGGTFTTVNGGATTRNRLAALSATTGTASAWDPNVGTATVNSIALSSDNATVYIGGSFTTVNGSTTRNRLAALSATTGTASAWDPNADSIVNVVVVKDDEVYVGGSFANVGGQPRANGASISVATGAATSWNPTIQGGSVRAFVFHSEHVFVGGLFINVGNFLWRGFAAFHSPSVQFTASSGTGGESSASPTVTVSLSEVSGFDVSVAFSVGGTATGGGTDHTLANGTATVTAGSTSTTVPLTVVNDSLDEPDETVTITLSNPSNATLGATTVFTYTILDDDVATHDLGVSVSDLVTRVKPGDSPMYRITVTNAGPADVTGVALSATVPSPTTFRLATDGGTASGTTVRWPSFTLASGASAARTFRLRITDPVATGIEAVAVTVTVADDGSSGADTNSGNNSAKDTNALVAAPKLAVSVRSGDGTPTAGETVPFTLAFANTGNQDASDVIVHIVVPEHTTFASAVTGSRWDCDPGIHAGGTCVFPLGTVTAGAGGSLPFNLDLDADFPAATDQLAVFARLTGTNAPDARTGPAPVIITETYTVVRGDSLWSIAVKTLGLGRLWTAIVDVNHDRFPSLITNPSLIRIGWALLIP